MDKQINWNKSSRKFTLIIPTEYVLAIGGKCGESLKVNLKQNIAKREIIIENSKKQISQIKNVIDAQKAINEYHKKKCPKKHKQKMKEFHTKIKEKQIESGIIEKYRQDLINNKVYMIENGISKKIPEEHRQKELDILGRD